MSNYVRGSTDLEALTKMVIEKFKFHWKVDLFSPVNLQASGNPIKSPVFSGGNALKYSWQLELIIAGNDNDSQLDLRLLTAGETESSKDGEMLVCGFASYKSEESALAEGVPKPRYQTVKCGQLLDTRVHMSNFTDNAKSYLSNNVITFHCVIFINLGLVHSNVTSRIVNSSDCIVKSLQTALKSGDLEVVHLITATKNISVHKIVLTSRSPVFAAMFRSDMQEAKMNSVEIKDFEENIVDAMVDFMYSGKTQLSTDRKFSPDLLRISDKYELLDLKLDVENFLQLDVKIENSIELLSLAYLYNCNALKMTAINFIHFNKEKLSGTKAFKKLGAGSHPEIMKELFLSMNKKRMVETESIKTLVKTHPEMLMELYMAN